MGIPSFIEESIREVLNVPYTADQLGQTSARAGLQTDPDKRNLDILKSISLFSEGFTALGSIFDVVPIKPGMIAGLGDVPKRTVNAHSTFGPASKPANSLRLNVELTLKDKGILDKNGYITPSAIDNSALALKPGDVLNYDPVVKALTKDGSNIVDWKKLTTETVEMSNGQRIQAHYYYNTKTQKVDYTYAPDFKVKNSVPVFPEKKGSMILPIKELTVKPYNSN